MKIQVPSPEIKLYDSGFEGFDLLDRRIKEEQLSDLVERIEDPLVIAVDGRWGSGKSFFLKCWVGAHAGENKGTAQTVYFDAFKNDFLDDPLISLTSAISERLETSEVSEKAVERIRNAVARLWRPVTRIGLAVASSGLSEVTGPLADAAVAASKVEIAKQVDALWKNEASHRAAMEQFREALIALTEPIDESGEHRKLVVAVDELDRCRPDYALSVLEVIKHFFDVPNVHFVLGVNLEELANSVRARYGDRTDAEQYLQKFISLTMTLPNKVGEGHSRPDVVKAYFSEMTSATSLNAQIIKDVEYYLERSSVARKYSLRSIERLLTEMALIPQSRIPFDRLYPGYRHLIAGLLVLKTVFPESYRRAKSGNFTIENVRAIFEISFPIDEKSAHSDKFINHVWTAFLKPEDTETSERWRNLFGFPGPREGGGSIEKYIDEYLEAINFGVSVK